MGIRKKRKKAKHPQVNAESSERQTQNGTLVSARLRKDGTLEYQVTSSRGWTGWVPDPSGKVKLPPEVGRQLQENLGSEVAITPIRVEVEGKPITLAALQSAVVASVVGEDSPEEE